VRFGSDSRSLSGRYDRGQLRLVIDNSLHLARGQAGHGSISLPMSAHRDFRAGKG